MFPRRLEDLYKQTNARQDVTAEQFIQIIEVMTMTENYFTSEQMKKLKQQGERIGMEKIKDVENEWPVLIAKVRGELAKGTPPGHPEVIQLAKRWKTLVAMFTGGDSEIRKSAERYYADNPDKAAQMGIDKELYQYITEAMSYS